MKGLWTILLLIVSNSFMTIAWYGHLKAQQVSPKFASLPLIAIIALSWAVAFFEYTCQVPANRLGFQGNGGPFSLVQLKVIQEVVTLTIFTLFSVFVFGGVTLKLNHLFAAICLVAAVYFVFK